MLLFHTTIGMTQQFEKRKKTSFEMSHVFQSKMQFVVAIAIVVTLVLLYHHPHLQSPLNVKKKLNPKNQMTKTCINHENQMTNTIINLKS